MPQADTLFIGRLPPGTAWTAGAKAAAPQIIDVEAGAPSDAIDRSGERQVRRGHAAQAAAGEHGIDFGRYRGDLRDWAARRVRRRRSVSRDFRHQRRGRTRRQHRLAAAVELSDLRPQLRCRISAMRRPRWQHRRACSPVSRSRCTAGSVDTLNVRTPSGRSVAIKREKGESFNFSDTDELGLYQIDEPNQEPRHFAVNLFDSAESNIQPRADHPARLQRRSWARPAGTAYAASYGKSYCLGHFAFCASNGISTTDACIYDRCCSCCIDQAAPPDVFPAGAAERK